MENTTLVWQYLLEHPATPWLAPIPWHLLGVLFFLSLLGGLGIHHLLSAHYQMYRVHDKQDPVLATASLILVCASMLVLVAAYVVITHSQQLTKDGLRNSTAQASAGKIGQILMEPLFGPPEVDLTGGQPGSRGQLQDLLMALPPAAYRQIAEKYMEQGRAELTRIRGNQETAVEKGLPPAREADGNGLEESPPDVDEKPGEASPSLQLLLLAMDWARQPDQEWPEAAPKPTVGGPSNQTLPLNPFPLPTPGHPDRQPGLKETPEAKSPQSTEIPKTEEAQPAPESDEATQEKQADASAPKADTPLPTPEAAEPPQSGPETKPDPFAMEQEEEPGEFPLPLFISSLVGEIREDALLMQHDWEHVAGSRFMEWVMHPLMVWHIQYSAILAAVLTLAANLLYFTLVRMFRRWLEAVPRFEIRKTA